MIWLSFTCQNLPHWTGEIGNHWIDNTNVSFNVYRFKKLNSANLTGKPLHSVTKVEKIDTQQARKHAPPTRIPNIAWMIAIHDEKAPSRAVKPKTLYLLFRRMKSQTCNKCYHRNDAINQFVVAEERRVQYHFMTVFCVVIELETFWYFFHYFVAFGWLWCVRQKQALTSKLGLYVPVKIELSHSCNRQT